MVTRHYFNKFEITDGAQAGRVAGESCGGAVSSESHSKSLTPVTQMLLQDHTSLPDVREARISERPLVGC
jgi:hypothetical protein